MIYLSFYESFAKVNDLEVEEQYSLNQLEVWLFPSDRSGSGRSADCFGNLCRLDFKPLWFAPLAGLEFR